MNGVERLWPTRPCNIRDQFEVVIFSVLPFLQEGL